MADWQNTINIVEEWQDEDLNRISKKIVSQLQLMRPLNDELEKEKKMLIELFSKEFKSVKEFDKAMTKLYDFGDTSLDGLVNGKKVCWIKVF